ncbi:YoaK family protein [Nocardia wallacei]|uniref:YoaK family protein n=1 Tax=Nocardia wallacei TaxID=480035 RepID=UPI002454A5EF|nr:YoaK family protein [Nocardia wallacei]
MPAMSLFTAPHRVLVLGYGSLLATVAGFVNAVAILTLAIPVGNVTATTTQLGMDAANPWMFETSLLVAIIVGFLLGAAAAGAILAPAKTHAGARHSAVMTGEALLLVLAFAWSGDLLSVFLAALACGMQNGTTSSLRTMQIRTTHFTGTVTDLGLLIGRARRHRIDRWKATVLAATVVTFITGGAAGTLAASRIGEAALLLPATICLGIALASLAYDRQRQSLTPPSTPEPQTDRDEQELVRTGVS